MRRDRGLRPSLGRAERTSLRGVLLAVLVVAACATPSDGGGPGPDAAPGPGDAAPGASDAAPIPVDGALWTAGGDLDHRVCPPDSFLTFDNFGSGFLSEFCVGCHSSQIPENMRQGAPMDLNFDDLDLVREHAPAMYLRAGDGYDTMPPAGGPDPSERILFGEWLACGAPL